jgi:predicted AlkP superfamily pyrophosphatase or phosphodiesterase
MSTHPLFLIIVFDGLRPDMVTPAAMPNLSRFMADGTNFTNARTVFPSSTRPSAAALASGSTPRHNGIIHNKYFDPNVFDDRMFQPNQVSDNEAAMDVYGGHLLTTPSLGDLAAEAGYSMATLLSGSSGTSRLINPQAKSRGHIAMGFRNWEDSCPADVVRELIEKHGPIPESGRPDIDAIRVQTDMVLESIYPDHHPDIMVTWFSDPDQTHHYHGVASAKMNTALRHVDAQFGRMVEWSQESDLKDRLQIIAISDHGHLTTRQRIDVNSEASKAGFKIDAHFQDGADYAGYTSYCGSLVVRDHDPGLMSAMVEWLFEQPWCGVVCTPDGDGVEGCIPGTFDHALALIDHPRAPEIFFIMDNDDAVTANGFVGSCLYNGAYPEGGGTHGGLHPKEMHMVMAAQGSLFKEEYASAHPAGIIDVAPTILELLRLNQPQKMDGRVLVESLVDSNVEPPTAETKTCSVECDGRVQHLKYTSVGSTTYLDAGWLQ